MTRHPLTVNGEAVAESVEPRTTLVDFVRETLGLTGSHVGCEHGVCGACTVLLNGEIVRGCLTLAVQCEGAQRRDHRGRLGFGRIADLQDAFRRRNALQCGFCTPGHAADRAGTSGATADPSRDTIREISRRELLPLHRLSCDCRRDRSVAQARAKG